MPCQLVGHKKNIGPSDRAAEQFHVFWQPLPPLGPLVSTSKKHMKVDDMKVDNMKVEMVADMKVDM